MPDGSLGDHTLPKSPQRTQNEQFDGHHRHWDPGGVRAFRSPTSTHEDSMPNSVVPVAYERERIVHVPDEDQLKESKGAVGPNKKPEGVHKGPSEKATLVQPDESTPCAPDETTLSNNGQESIGSPVSASVEHMSSEREADNASPLNEVVMMPSMSLPTSGDSYVPGLSPVPCSETFYKLDRAAIVTGMLPFRK